MKLKPTSIQNDTLNNEVESSNPVFTVFYEEAENIAPNLYFANNEKAFSIIIISKDEKLLSFILNQDEDGKNFIQFQGYFDEIFWIGDAVDLLKKWCSNNNRNTSEIEFNFLLLGSNQNQNDLAFEYISQVEKNSFVISSEWFLEQVAVEHSDRIYINE